MILVVAIVLLIIIVYITNKDTYVIRPYTSSDANIKDIGETYDYLNCLGCLSNNNKLIPKFKYNISDNRCFFNNTNNYIDNSLPELTNYNYNSLQNFESCTANYNSLYSSIYGQYIMIFRTDAIKMKMTHISIHERDVNLNPLIADVYATNLEKIAGEIIFPERILNSLNDNITFESGNNMAYILISLRQPTNIGYINIKHANTTDAATLNGSNVVIMNTTTDEAATVVFYTMITTIHTDRIVYTYNYLNTMPNYQTLPNYISSNVFRIYNKWILPCDNCTNSNNDLLMNHYYKLPDSRCYRPKTLNIKKTVIETDMSNDIINTNFNSCDNKYDTRFKPPLCKFIHITNTKTTIISKIQLYSDFSFSNVNTTNLSALVNTYLNNVSLFENVLDDVDSTILSFDSKILINLPSNTYISSIAIKVPIAERLNLIGLKISFVMIDELYPFDISRMIVTSQKIITNSDVDISNAIVTNNMYTFLFILNNNLNDTLSQHTDIVINNIKNYDYSNKYLSTYKKGQIYYQIPYVIYYMANGRSVMAKTLDDSVNTLDKINISDGVTLFNIPTDSRMSSTNNGHILKPISTRYIQILPAVSKSLNGVVSQITLYDSNSVVIKTINPVIVLYINNHIDYISYLSNVVNTDSMILIDMGIDTPITFIKIDINGAYLSSFINSSISLINDIGNKVYTYVFTNPTINNYLITDNNEINVTGSFFLKKFAYPECITSKSCTNILPDTHYISTDVCFKSKPIIDSSLCIDCISKLSEYSMNPLPNRALIDSLFVSCKSGTDTRIKPITYYVIGKKIKIISINAIALNNISIYYGGMDLIKSDTTLNISNPITGINNMILGTNTNPDFNANAGSIEVDLLSNNKITTINIGHNNINDYNALSNNELQIITNIYGIDYITTSIILPVYLDILTRNILCNNIQFIDWFSSSSFVDLNNGNSITKWTSLTSINELQTTVGGAIVYPIAKKTYTDIAVGLFSSNTVYLRPKSAMLTFFICFRINSVPVNMINAVRTSNTGGKYNTYMNCTINASNKPSLQITGYKYNVTIASSTAIAFGKWSVVCWNVNDTNFRVVDQLLNTSTSTSSTKVTSIAFNSFRLCENINVDVDIKDFIIVYKNLSAVEINTMITNLKTYHKI